MRETAEKIAPQSVGALVLADGKIFRGLWHDDQSKPLEKAKETAGEVVFNTSHSGYEEIATDPSYYSQIMVTTASMQGNYGIDRKTWESDQIFIRGFICLEVQDTPREHSWKKLLLKNNVPLLSEVDTRNLVLTLREGGTTFGALLKVQPGETDNQLKIRANKLIDECKKQDSDWAYAVSKKTPLDVEGEKKDGPRIALLDYGTKNNIVRELQKRCSLIRIFPSRTSAKEIRDWNPHGIMLSNGPGDPADIQKTVETVKDLIGWRFIFGICMGHQILSLALGAKTFKLKYGHRGGNHPIEDRLLGQIYMTSQNHGYGVDPATLPSGVTVSHINLNDQTVSGIYDKKRLALGIQFHPESCPGPHDSRGLFDFFVRQIT